jgi:hypothetical protein
MITPLTLHELYQWLRRHVSTIAFVGGFVTDKLTLTRIDLVSNNLVFVGYLLATLCGILLVHTAETRPGASTLLTRYKPWLPILVQFPIGGLFSGFVIFYTKSASIFTSWLFLAILLVLFVGNEFLHKRYERLVFQVSMFYFALLSYFVMLVPILVGEISAKVFILSGISSLFVIALVLQVVMRLFPDVYKRSVKELALSVGGIFVLWNVLYFANIIPPVPLALQDIGVYHSVVRTDGTYQVTYEPPAWYEVWRDTAYTFHRPPGAAAYCFSAVFAPTTIGTRIYHRWMHQNADGVWVRVSSVPFTIQGGREAGYRGYTIKSNLSEGLWRCVVETEDGKVLGEQRFNVVGVQTAPMITSGTR